MPFDPDLDVPDGLITAGFILRPIVAADAEMDHAAVMESKEFLRKWEQTSWPEDDFTVAANREDLEKLERRHSSREAFTYTVIDPSDTVCLGCVYIIPTNAPLFTKATITQVDDQPWSEFQSAVYFWVRQSRLESGTDAVLLDALRDWLARDWSLRGHLVVTNEQFTQQVGLIEATDLELRFQIEEPDKPGRYLAFG